MKTNETMMRRSVEEIHESGQSRRANPSRKLRVLSHSAMSMYEKCPQRWKLRYVDRHKQEPRSYLSLGTATHAALECFYRKRISAPASVEKMLQAFDEALDPAAFSSPEELERARADGRLMVGEFHAKNAPDFRPALAVEESFYFELEGVRLVAKVDRIDKEDDAGVGVVDYKTGRAFTVGDVQNSPQLTLYQIAVEATLGMEVRHLELYHVPTQTPFRVPRHGEEQVQAARRRVRAVAGGIRREEFEPRPGRQCEWCDFRRWCPAFAHEYPEEWEEKARAAGEGEPEAPSLEEAQKLADRLGELRARTQDLQREQKQVRDELVSFFRTTGERSVAGDVFQAWASRGIQHEFDEAELRRILEPEGLWERVLRPNRSAEQALLDDPELSGALLDRIRSIARPQERWTVRLCSSCVDSPSDTENPGPAGGIRPP